jgi:hypothetical protein
LGLNETCHATQHEQQAKFGKSAVENNWFVVCYHMC